MTLVKLEAGNSHSMNKHDDLTSRVLPKAYNSTAF